jgi:hypothetical protein
VRQYELALEKKWLTQDQFFRLHTTLTGMTVADVWKLASFHKLISTAKYEEGKPVISINKFSCKTSIIGKRDGVAIINIERGHTVITRQPRNKR